MGDSVKFISENILRSGTVTTTQAGDTGYPASRLYDWSRDLMFKATYDVDSFGFDGDRFGFEDDGFGGFDANYFDFQVDQGDNPIAIDALWIAGHNFDEHDVSWQYSNDGETWTNAVTTFTQDGTDDILKELGSSVTAQYWRVRVKDVEDPQVGEIVIGIRNSFEIMHSPSPTHGFRANVIWSESVGGQERAIKLSDDRRLIGYTLRLSASDLTTLESVFTDTEGFSLPVVVIDKDGNPFLMRFDPLPTETFFHKTYTEIDINLLELL